MWSCLNFKHSSHYGQMYRINYGTNKTKITVVGSEIDQNHFSDVKPWTMDNEVVKILTMSTVSENKNIDLRLEKGRKNMHSFLGAFSYKCLLSPVLKIHIFFASDLFQRWL